MKFMVVLCLFALAVAEEDIQDQTQQNENIPSPKPTLTPQPTQGFTGQAFPTTPLNFGGKDGIGNVPFTGFVGTNFPQFPQQAVSPDFFANTQGVVNGGLPAFAQVPKTAYQGTTGLPANLQSGFHVPVVNGLGNHFTGLTGGAYPSFQNGAQGVPVGSFGPTNTGNVGFTGLPGSPYRVLPQQGITGFAPQGLTQNVLPTNAGLPTFSNVFPGNFPNGVFTGNQGVLKAPLTGTGHTPLNVPTLTTGDVQTDTTGSVFRRA
ncbi:hypothetical protein RUM43_011468 [Polyplax serrata]|uniref:Uncharacterized protein n=1 Tax=Polyplax serrata TaxID=468196 RepID=A0AAN8P912_POLSC